MALTGISKSNKRLDCNVIHQYFEKKLEFNLREDDITSKINFLLEKHIFSNNSASKGDYFYFTENAHTLLKLLKILLNLLMKMLRLGHYRCSWRTYYWSYKFTFNC